MRFSIMLRKKSNTKQLFTNVIAINEHTKYSYTSHYTLNLKYTIHTRTQKHTYKYVNSLTDSIKIRIHIQELYPIK